MEDHKAYLELMTKLEHQGFVQRNSKNGLFVAVEEQKVTHARFKYIDPLARISDYVCIFRYVLGRAPSLLIRILNY